MRPLTQAKWVLSLVDDAASVVAAVVAHIPAPDGADSRPTQSSARREFCSSPPPKASARASSCGHDSGTLLLLLRLRLLCAQVLRLPRRSSTGCAAQTAS